MRCSVVVTFLRFEVSCRELGIELKRWANRTARQNGMSHLCEQACLDDEKHLAFGCLRLGAVQEQYSCLSVGPRGSDLRTHFAQRDHQAVDLNDSNDHPVCAILLLGALPLQ